MFEEPQVARVAEALAACLDCARTREAGSPAQARIGA